MKTIILFLFSLVFLHAENETSFRELFADPQTRPAALATLTPGTRDHFFHTALDHQLNNRSQQYAETIAAWKVASQEKTKRVSTSGLEILENRRIISSYDQSPEEALAELTRLLDLRFDARKPDSAAANRELPTSLPPESIAPAAFQKIAEQANPEAAYLSYNAPLLYSELNNLDTFSENKIRWFARNFKRPDHPRYTDLVAKALAIKPPLSSSSFAFATMTRAQLDELALSTPSLRSEQDFNLAYLKKLTPPHPAELSRHPVAHAAFLTACKDYVAKLPPSQNSRKALILYRHLELQETLGNHPLDDFLAYLALPRASHSILRADKESEFSITSNRDFRDTTFGGPVDDDSKLIFSYLQHHLAKSDTAQQPFVPFIEKSRLATLHAEARLLAGADPTRWAPVLNPETYKSLREETRISFAPTVPELFTSSEKVSLPLDLKNTPSLLIRIYEIDSESGDESPSIDLDGLVPHHTRTLTFEQAPIVQHREDISLPELEGAGTWIVEFVSERISARAMIRKGNLTPHLARTPEGQVIRLFDENSQPLTDFKLTLGTEQFTAKDGTITVPDSANQPVRSSIITSGKLTTKISLDSRTESHLLETDFFLDREQLLANREATLRIRNQLTNHGQPVELSLLKDPVLVLKAKLLGGITTERTIADPLPLAATNEIPFLVPADLVSLTFTLTGTVTSSTSGEEKTLIQSTTYGLNGALQTSRIATALFSPTSTGHQLHLRGRNGEALANRPLSLKIFHERYQKPITTELRSDDSGLIKLGPLFGISKLIATSADIATTTYQPPARELSIPAEYIVPAGQKIEIPRAQLASISPAENPLTPEEVVFQRIVNSDGVHVLEDLFLILQNNPLNQIQIENLPPGNYRLIQRDSIETAITVLPAESRQGQLLVTDDKILPLTAPTTPTVSSTNITDETLTVRIANPSPETRVTIIAKRYAIDGWLPGTAPFPFAPDALNGLTRSIRPSSYLTERKISDEMRYILDRRIAKTFPGNMLPRPGQLLYRWTPDELDQDDQSGRGGFGGIDRPKTDSGGGAIPSAMRKRRSETARSSHPTTIDFLQFPAAVKFNLKPDADGKITVPLADFQGAQFIEIIAADTYAADTVFVPLPPSETALTDRRLTRALDPDSHHLATRFAAALAPGAEATINNLLDADWRAFTTLAEAHQFLLATSGDDRIRDFTFLTTWPELEEPEKLALLADHHCHELHLFLFRKDPDFFTQHIKPFLIAKPQPQFIDDYLLARGLTKYLRPYAFSRLNAAEKALLAQALLASKKDISRELDLRWKTESPSPEAETILFTQTLKGADLSPTDSLGLARNRSDIPSFSLSSNDGHSEGVSFINEKLRRIIIPRIDFENTTLEEAIDFLRLRARELDTLELDPSKKGMNFVVRPGAAKQRIAELRLENVPVSVALKYICDITKTRYRQDDFAITIVPQTETGEDLFTRTFRVPPDFAAALAYDDGSSGDIDPFAEVSNRRTAALTARPPIIELLKKSGISFPEGSSATLGANGVLLVTGPPSELDKVEKLTDIFVNQGKPSANDSHVDAFAEAPAVDAFATGRALSIARPLLFPDRTKLWLESNYYKHRGETGESLIPLNRFWLELSAWDGKAPFTSPHFNACTRSASEALMCLAMLDLPFTAEKPEVAVDQNTLKVKARAPMLLFYKDTRVTENIAPESPLLVRQSYHPLAEPFRTDGQDRKIENTVTGDFRTGVPYGLSLVVTNPTGTERRIETLAQIPTGSIPLASSMVETSLLDGVLPPPNEEIHAPETLSTSHKLEPYGVVQLQLAFYFPAPGDYPAYPLHVAEGEQILAHAQPRTLRVSADPAPEDSASWLVLARDGSDEAVLNRLSTENLSTISLHAIQWRMNDRDFFVKASEILHTRLANAPEIFLYGLLHDDAKAINGYLSNLEIVNKLGQWFSSDLITITPTTHHGWKTMEFDPLVNPRSHRFGENPHLSHAQAQEHYESFLDTLAWKPTLSSADELTFTYFLFLQDRIDEALARFAKIKPADLPDPLQYDYLHASALFYQEKPAEAKAIAAPYLAKLPPGTWRDRFEAVTAHADEISRPVAAIAEKEKETYPTLGIFAHEDDSDKILLKHSNLAEASIRLYHIDLEILFSKDPFLKGGVESSLPPIAPNLVATVPLNQDGTTLYTLPEEFSKGNILVGAEAENVKRLKVIDSQAIEIRTNPTERTVQIIDPATGKPLPKTYVKVFAESADGSTDFHKDGYTDLRGKFDYLSHTATDPATIQRLAILVSHPEKGSRTTIINR